MTASVYMVIFNPFLILEIERLVFSTADTLNGDNVEMRQLDAC